MIDKILAWLGRAWKPVKDFLELLKLSRFSLIIVSVAIAALLWVPALEDILVGLSHPQTWLQVLLFVLAVNWLAFQAWGWARYIFSRHFDGSEDQRWKRGWRCRAIEWLPRIYAIAAFGIAAFAAFGADIAGIAWLIIVVGVAAAWLLFERRRIEQPGLQRFLQPKKHEHHIITAGVLVISALFAIFAPVGFGNALGAGAVLFLGLGCIIPAGSWLVALARENGFPVVSAALVAALFFSFVNDNHHVRLLDETPATAKRLHTLDAYVDEWAAQAAPGKPMVLVATAGGGLRASYWTGVVLGRLQDAVEDFHRQVFAISGVSGGSVGAVFYAAALADETGCTAEDSAYCFTDRLLAAIGRDYLAPVSAALLYPDLMQRFFPLAIFPDRAAALERSWEQGFRDTYPAAPCGLDGAFLDLFQSARCRPEGHWAPLLLINGTYEQTGRRILTTPFALEPGLFPDSHDFYPLNGDRPIPASTAAHNSARFSYVSPAGTFGDGAGSIIDGGYFENYGATTLADLLRYLQARHADKLARRGLVVIAISNDAEIPLAQYEIAARPLPKPFDSFLNEALAPARGLLATRAAHGMLAYKQLHIEANADRPGGGFTWAHFYLGDEPADTPGGETEVPLTWILSYDAQQFMRRQVAAGTNCGHFEGIARAMGMDDVEC